MGLNQFALVGCTNCSQLWITEDLREQSTAECPCCGADHRTDKLEALFDHDDYEVVAEIRARKLATRAGEADAYAETDDYGVQAEKVDEQLDALGASGERVDSYLNDGESRFDELVDAYFERSEGVLEEAVEEHFDQRYAHLETNTADTPDPDGLYDERGGVDVATPGQQQLGSTLHGVTPYRSDEVSRILDELLPTFEQAVRKLAAREDRPVEQLTVPLGDEPVALNHLADEYGISGGHGAFATEIVEWVTRDYSEWPDNIPADQDSPTKEQTKNYHTLRDALLEYGSGQDPENRDLDGLRTGPVALLQTADVTPTLNLVLDGPEWTELEDKRTAERLLGVLDTLAKAVEIRISASPRVQRTLDNWFPDWADQHDIDLTAGRDGSPAEQTDTEERSLSAAYHTLRQFNGDGRRRLLASLSTEPRSIRDVKADPEVDLAESSVDRYVGDLEEMGFVDVDRRDGLDSNQASLTQFGELANRLITPTFDLLPPEQQKLGEQPYATPTETDKYSVSRTGEHGEVPPRSSPAAWLAATGSAGSPEHYTQWMDGHGSEISPYALQKRNAVVSQSEGITLADADVPELQDGRVVCLGVFEDTLEAVTQWGGSAATLGRIAAALSSGKVWGKILTPEALGDDLSALHDIDATPEDVLDNIQRGDQIGWAGEDDIRDEDGLDYYAFRDRLYGVGRRLLSRLAELDDFDQQQRAAFYEDAHGLSASMTKLLDAVGVDVDIHLRFPEADNAIDDPDVHRDVVQFMRHTVPKHSAYGIHSAYRQVVEEREEQLKFRKPIKVEEANPEADLTASWILAGEGIDRLHDDLVAAIKSVEPRESIQNGEEESIGITVPISVGGTTGHIKQIVRQLVEQKGWCAKLQDIDRITRALMSALSHAPGRASPYLVADALLAMGKRKYGSGISVSDVRAGLATIAPADLYPTLPDTVGKLVSALLRSHEPLEAAELADAAGVSRRSYSRHIETLTDLDLLRRSDDGWRATLAPWWLPGSTADPDPTDRTTPGGDTIMPREPMDVHEVLEELAHGAEWRDGVDGTTVADLYAEHGGRPSLDELLDAIPRLQKWWPVISALWPDDESSETGGTLRTHDTAAVGRSDSSVSETGGTLRDPDTGVTTASIGAVDTDTSQKTIT